MPVSSWPCKLPFALMSLITCSVTKVVLLLMRNKRVLNRDHLELDRLAFSDFVDGIIIGLGALTAVIFVCFLIGLMLRTGIGAALETRYDHLLEKYLPVVGMLRNLVMQIVGSREEVLKLKPAEVSLYGSSGRQYALIVEELPDGRVVVFVPAVPAATLGQLHVLPLSEVTLLDTPVQEFLNAVTQWGAGASLMYRKKD